MSEAGLKNGDRDSPSVTVPCERRQPRFVHPNSGVDQDPKLRVP